MAQLSTIVSTISSPYVTFGFLFATIGIWGGYVVGVLASSRRAKKIQKKLANEFTAVYHDYDRLDQKMSLVRDHYQEYFHTLASADFPRLERLMVTVAHAIEVAEVLQDEGELVQALRIIMWVNNPHAPEPMDRRFSKEQRDVIASWKQDARDMLIHIVEAISTVHAENRDSGIQRRRPDRSPTDVDLQRLREALQLDQ